MINLFKTTKDHRQYWKTRKIDWKQSYWTPEHPHRNRIVELLGNFDFHSVLEVGCAAGANLQRIHEVFPRADIGGIDWNADAIGTAKGLLPRASILQVGDATDIYLSSKGADILLSDMAFIYLDKRNFRKALKEAKRVARKGVIFCEFHHSRWVMRVFLKYAAGYFAYNFRRELEREGFYDIAMYKLTDEDWPGGEPQKTFAWIITART